MYLLKAGESHGEAMTGILCNVPAGIKTDVKFLDFLLSERNRALGRSVRQTLENDRTELLTGVLNGESTGGNISFVISNAVKEGGVRSPITALRPGHADLPGLMRSGFKDIRMVSEGASARNTCLDTVGGGVALCMMKMLGVMVYAFPVSLGKIRDGKKYGIKDLENLKSLAFSPDADFASQCVDEINAAKEKGETLGGTIEVRVSGLKGGFGSYVAEKRIDSHISRHIFGLQAVKGIYFGEDPFGYAGYGSGYNGEIIKGEKGFECINSKAGGIEGGMTDGGEISFTVAVKPLPTLQKKTMSCDYVTGKPCSGAVLRSDVTAVFALCPVLRCVTALVLSEEVSERIGCDNMEKIIKRYEDL